ncbi:MAG: carotenoid oxygenase family protein, partial [Planctomycetia bacterium]
LNAYSAGEVVTVDLVAHPSYEPGPGLPHLRRYEMNLATKTLREEELDDRMVEFPRLDPRRAGLFNRYGYAAGRAEPQKPEEIGVFDAVVQYDLKQKRSAVKAFGAGAAVGEPVFLPNPEADGETDGWVMTLVYDRASDRSWAVLLAADDFAGEPVARVEIPRRVPLGFHGSWVPDPA